MFDTFNQQIHPEEIYYEEEWMYSLKQKPEKDEGSTPSAFTT